MKPFLDLAPFFVPNPLILKIMTYPPAFIHI